MDKISFIKKRQYDTKTLVMVIDILSVKKETIQAKSKLIDVGKSHNITTQ